MLVWLLRQLGLKRPDDRQVPRVPELIVCRDHSQAREIKKQLPEGSFIEVIGPPSVHSIGGRPWPRITVCEDVDLNADLDGNGPLGECLRRRQMVWGNQAILIQLKSGLARRWPL